MTVDLKHKPVLLNQTYKQISSSSSSSSASLPQGKHGQTDKSLTSAKNSAYQCLRLNRLAMKQFLVTLLLILGCVSMTRAQGRETAGSFYHYEDAKAIHEVDVNNNEIGQSSNFESLINKDFFTIYSSNDKILNSVENHSRNNDQLSEKIYATNIDSDDNEFSPNNNPIPIARFRPAFLDFKEQEIGIAKSARVVITNLGEDELNFESISGSTIHFYCSFFTEKVISPGGNTSFDVHFLARQPGLTQSAIYINTNKGIIKYNVQGAGIENIYKLKPVLNARILLNTSFTSHIHLHNPHNYSLQVVEIFTSDDDLHLEMPLYSAGEAEATMTTTTTTEPINFESAASTAYGSDKQQVALEHQKILIRNNNNNKNKSQLKKSYLKYYTNNNSSNIKQLWNLRPFESKSIAVIRYMGRQANNHTAFISVVANLIQSGENNHSQQQQTKDNNNIKKAEETIVNSSISFTLPIEIEVTEQPGIYSPLKLIYFGAMSLTANKSLDEYSRWLFNNDKADTAYRDLIYFSQRVNSSVRTVDLFIVNSAPRPLIITDVYSVRHNSALDILVNKNIEVPADTKVLTKVAEIKFDPTKSKRASQNYGKIIVATNDKSIWLQINFVADVYQGSLDYNKEKANFFTSIMGARIKQSARQTIELKNNYSFPIVVHNISLNRDARQYFEISDFTSPVLVPQSLNYKPVFKIRFDLKKFLEDNANNGSEPVGKENFSLFNCIVHTNFTSFEIPLHVYDGKLSFEMLNGASSNKSDLLLNPIEINSTRETPIHIDNFNPIDIKFTSLELHQKVTSSKHSKSIKNKLGVKFVRFESLADGGSEHRQIYINRTFENDEIKKNLKIPALHRMLVILTVDTRYQGSDEDFFNSLLYEYELVITTKYQPHIKLKIEFTVVKGALQLVDVFPRDSRLAETFSSELRISAFPTRLSTYPLKIRSQFASDLQVSSVEFKGFGDAFTFKWIRDPDHGLGRVKSNGSSVIGQILFNPQFTCIPFCYLGLAPRKRVSIIDRTSLFIQSIEDINVNTEKSQIYDLWIKSFTLQPIPSVRSKTNENLTTFEVDSFLFTFLREHWYFLTRHKDNFLSSMTVLLKHKTNSNPLFSYRFPIDLKFHWPRLVESGGSMTEFPLLQLHSSVFQRNVSIFNPSNSNLLVQVILASNYTQRRSLYEFVESHDNFFYGPKHRAIVKSLIQRAQKKESEQRSYFRLKFNQKWNTLPNSNVYDPNDFTEDLGEEFEQLNIQPDTKNSFLFVLEPNKQINLQVEFYPEKIGTFEDMLIIRNNLTVLDVQTISAQVGTADLRINNLPPMRSSLFFNNQVEKNSPTHFQTTDYSNIIMQMNKNDFEHCTSTSSQADLTDAEHFLNAPLTDQYSHILNKIFHDDSQEPTVRVENNTQDGVELVFMSQELSSSYENNYKSSFKFKDGIVLRGHLILKNIGNTHLNVMNVIFDGESCFSRGIEVTYCSPFSIAPFDEMAPLNESVFLLEIRYRPDFTMANIKKSLVLETNIGELRYSIEVQIPHYMLSTCHDSLPRPPLESYLFYLGMSLVALLMLVMLLTSMVESRSIIKYQYDIYKQIYSMSETKQWFSGITSDNEEYEETSTVKECQTTTAKAHNTNKQHNKKVENKKSSNKSKSQQHQQQNPPESSPHQNHSHRNLTKAVGNQRSTGNNHMSSDSSVSSSSCSSVSKKQSSNVNSSPKAEKAKHQNNTQQQANIVEAPASTHSSDEQKTEVRTAMTSPVAFVVSSSQAKATSGSGRSTPNTHSTKSSSKSSATKRNNSSRPATPLTNPTLSAVETVKPVEEPVSKKLSKAMTAAAIQNDSMASQRKAYLNQQKSQIKASKSTSDDNVKATTTTTASQNNKSESPNPSNKNNSTNINKLPNSSSHGSNSINGAEPLSKIVNNQARVKTSHNQTPFESQPGNKNIMNNSSKSSSAKHLNIGAALFSPAETYLPGSNHSSLNNKLNTHNNHLSEKLEIELLNSQLQQLQQQKQQISYLNGAPSSLPSSKLMLAQTNQSESSSSPSPTSSSSSSASNRQRIQHQQNKQKSELFDMIMNYTNRFDNNEAYDYDSMVAQTEDFKQTILDNQPRNRSGGSPFIASDIQPSVVEQTLRNNELDKILYSLINQESSPNNISQDGFASFPTDNSTSSGFLGPIQRPSNQTYPPNLRPYDNILGFNGNSGNDHYDKDPFENADIKLNNQYSVGSNLKLTGEYIAILNALFSARSQEMANNNNSNKQTRSMLSPSFMNGNTTTSTTASNTTSTNNNSNSGRTGQSIPVKQPLHKAKSVSNDRTRFQEFRLFENSNSSGVANNKSNILLESSFSNPGTITPSASYWPMTSDASSSLTGKEGGRTSSNSSAPWNSVLLNDFDDFAAPSSLNNSSTGNHIKSLWATTKQEPTAAEVLANKKKL